MVGTVLLCFAFVFALFEAFGWPKSDRVHLGWLAFSCFVAASLLGPFFR